MPGEHSFEHLPLILRERGRAKLIGFGKLSPQTVANMNVRQAHSASLTSSGQSLKAAPESVVHSLLEGQRAGTLRNRNGDFCEHTVFSGNSPVTQGSSDGSLSTCARFFRYGDI